MRKPVVSKKKADIISNGAFLISLGILFYTNTWWPWILLAIWLTLGLRQYLTARTYDFIFTTVLLWGLFLTSEFDINWSLFIPILFVLGGIYIICRESFFGCNSEGQDKADEVKEDLEEEKNNN